MTTYVGSEPEYLSTHPGWVKIGRAFLISIRHRPTSKLPTYEEFAASYGGKAKAARYVLNSIWAENDRGGEPNLASLVVLKNTGLPGLYYDGQPLHANDVIGILEWTDDLHTIRNWKW